MTNTHASERDLPALDNVLNEGHNPPPPSPSTYKAATGWAEPETIHTTASPIGSPLVVVDTEGRVHILWSEDGWLWHMYRAQNGWTEPKRPFMGVQPSADVDTHGFIHMAFVHAFGGRYQVYYTTFRDPLWAIPYEISRTPGLSQHPHLLAAPNGLIYVVWEDDTPGFSSIYHAYNPEGHWINAPVPGARGWRPVLTHDHTGAIHLLWEGAMPTRQGDDIYHSQLTRDGWTLPENISDSPDRDSAAPAAAPAQNGMVHVVWQERLGPRSVIGYAFGQYASWRKPLALSEPGTHQMPYIVTSPHGYVHALWTEGSAILHRSRGPVEDAVWHSTEEVVRHEEPIVSFQVRSDKEGRVHLVWITRSEKAWALHYRWREPAMKHKHFLPTVSTGGDANAP